MSDAPSPKRDLFLPASILAAGVLIAGSIIYLVGAKNTPAVGPSAGDEGRRAAALLAVLEDDAVLGSKDAPVMVIEYGDYQCPFCGSFFRDIEPALRDTYIKTGKAKFVYRDFAFLGPESLAAAEAAECAREQGQFWAYHDGLFRAEVADKRENNGNLNAELFGKLAQDAGLDVSAFESCRASGKYRARIGEETSDGRVLGVNATPTAFVNGVEIRGLAPNDTRVADAIEAALKTAK
ncbi:MAG: thioredoxin domain-containing protein [Candidatus Liptonbacteria bacterium]|nr:thioredoxin domain-containing protein [Candidatus Liptonbacteria bacterium]